MIPALVVGLEIDYAKLLTSVIRERAFKTATTYPLTCFVFQLCRDDRVPIHHYDVLRTRTRTVDIGLIRDEANVAAPRRGPRVELKPLSENLADTVELDQGVYPSTSEPTETTPAESDHGTKRAPTSSRSTPSL